MQAELQFDLSISASGACESRDTDYTRIIDWLVGVINGCIIVGEWVW